MDEQVSRYLADQDRQLMKYPVCDKCGEHITDEYRYEVDGEYMCEECFREYVNENFRVFNEAE